MTLGYNWQGAGSPWVFGLEGDLNWSDIKGSFANAACPFGCQIKSEWLGTARGRVGYAIDRFMPYVTGGVAFGDVQRQPTGFAGAGDTNVGWTLGAGIEGAIAPNWTAKAEYLYVDLGSTSCGVLVCGAGDQRRLHAAHRARRLELQVLIGTIEQQGPGRKSGAFCMSGSISDAGFLQHWFTISHG